MTLTVGVDVGGTKIAAGVVDENGEVLTSMKRTSPAAERSEIIRVIGEMVNELAAQHEVVSVGIGAAGFINANRNTITYGTNLDWTGEDLGDRIHELCGLPVVVENDANAAGWAEARFGAAKGKDNALVVTLGTGVGGAIVANGQLLRGGAGFAAEVGHITSVPGGRPCGCGRLGCLERYASGTALGVSGRELAHFRPDYGARMIELAGGDVDKVTGKCVTGAAREGDAAALSCYADLGYRLGVGLADLCAILDPEVIVLAGGLTEAGDILLEPTRKAFNELLTAGEHRPEIPIVIAQCGQAAGLVGAADLARQ